MNKISYNFPFIFILTFLFSLFACTPQTTQLSPEIATSPETNTPTIIASPTDEPTTRPTLKAQADTKPQTVTPIPTILANATSTPISEPQPTDPPPAPKAAYAVVGVASDDQLNVRQEAGIRNEIVGKIDYNSVGIHIISEPRKVDEAPWVQIEHDGLVGWVNKNYLAGQAGEPSREIDQAIEIIQAIEMKNFAEVAKFAHPTKGVRFSPYTYVSETDIVFQKDELAEAMANPTVYFWGSFDGSGDPINLTFDDYYQRFIYDASFVWPHNIGFNQFIGWSNTINNIPEFYPNSQFVEYHFSGIDEEMEGLDWRSLRLIFEEQDGKWYLVGIIHTEWTI